MRLKFLLPATLIIIMVAFLTSLGFWQLDRADEPTRDRQPEELLLFGAGRGRSGGAGGDGLRGRW